MGLILGAVVGALVAWSVPQPQWAKNVQAKIAALFTEKAV